MSSLGDDVNNNNDDFEDEAPKRPGIQISNPVFLKGIFGDDWKEAHVTGFAEPPDAVVQIPAGLSKEESSKLRKDFERKRRGSWKGARWSQGDPWKVERDGKSVGGMGKSGREKCAKPWSKNTFFVISKFNERQDGTYGRTADRFAGCHCISIDDVGIGAGAKVSFDTIDDSPLLPSWVLETSLDNHQVGFAFREPVQCKHTIDVLIEHLIQEGLLFEDDDGGGKKKDPGMKNITRYQRLPCGVNNKLKYDKPFEHILHEWHPAARYSVEEICVGFGIDYSKVRLEAKRRRVNAKRRKKGKKQLIRGGGDEPEGFKDSDPTVTWLRETNRLGDWNDSKEFFEIICPDLAEHSDEDESGTVYYPWGDQPDGTHNPQGSVHCMHGHCQGKTREHWDLRMNEDAAAGLYDPVLLIGDDFDVEDIKDGHESDEHGGSDPANGDFRAERVLDLGTSGAEPGQADDDAANSDLAGDSAGLGGMGGDGDPDGVVIEGELELDDAIEGELVDDDGVPVAIHGEMAPWRPPGTFCGTEEDKYEITKDYRLINNETEDEIANFCARIVATLRHDDGVIKETRYLVQIRFKETVLGPFEIRHKDFDGMRWLGEYLPTQSCLAAGHGNRDMLRESIRRISDGAKVLHSYGHLGWRDLNYRDNTQVAPPRWVYLHGGGCIDEQGLHENPRSSMATNVGAQMYQLPEPLDGSELVYGGMFLDDILDLVPAHPEVGGMLLALIFRAPLQEFKKANLSGFLSGTTGSMKSSVAAVAQSFFGAGFNVANLPVSWQSTITSMEKELSCYKDALCIVDDFKPSGGRRQQDELYSKADQLLHLKIGNDAVRGRADAQLNSRPEYKIRALVLSTGETLPPGESLRARVSHCHMEPDTVDVKVLGRLQRAGSDGILAGLMSSYIQWLAPQVEKLKFSMSKRFLQMRHDNTETFDHLRFNDAVNELSMGLEMMTRFMVEHGLRGVKEAKLLENRARQAVVEVYRGAGESLKETNQAESFCDALKSGLKMGKFHLLDRRTGSRPVPRAATDFDEGMDSSHFLQACGWRLDQRNIESGYVPHGQHIGWVDEKTVHIHPISGADAIIKLAQLGGQDMALGKKAILTMLRQRDMLSNWDGKAGGKLRNTIKSRVTGSLTRTLQFDRPWVFEEDLYRTNEQVKDVDF